jgi:glucose-1-phosphate adenylyltransferase
VIGSGSLINGGKIRNSILRREVTIEEGVEIDDCIIMDYTTIRRGAHLRRVIVDRYNIIARDERIGFDPTIDVGRFTITESGIVVVPRAPARAVSATGAITRYM